MHFQFWIHDSLTFIFITIFFQNVLRQTLYYNYEHYRDLGTGTFKNEEFIVKTHVSKYYPHLLKPKEKKPEADQNSPLPRHPPAASHVHS